MKVVGYVAVFAGGLVFMYLLVSLGVLDAYDGIPGTLETPAVTPPTYLNFIGVMLTAVTVVLTAVAIGIGVVAAYTFREIRESAMATVEKKASEALAPSVIQGIVAEITFNMGIGQESMANEELQPDFDPEDNGER